MKPHLSILMSRMSAIAANAGFAGLSVEFAQASSSGKITHTLLAKARHVAFEECRTNEMEQLRKAADELPVLSSEEVSLTINGEQVLPSGVDIVKAALQSYQQQQSTLDENGRRTILEVDKLLNLLKG